MSFLEQLPVSATLLYAIAGAALLVYLSAFFSRGLWSAIGRIRYGCAPDDV